MYQRNLTTVNLKNFNISSVVNHKTNLKINVGLTSRIPCSRRPTRPYNTSHSFWFCTCLEEVKEVEVWGWEV